MGLFTGFDMVPRLSEKTEDQKSWECFIQAVKKHYQNDDLIEAKQNCIIVKVDRDLVLPSEGHKLLRFCSKISVRHAEGVEDYLDTITQIAEEHFGSRVHTWEEELGQEGFYRWVDVYDSRKYFEQVHQSWSACHQLYFLMIFSRANQAFRLSLISTYQRAIQRLEKTQKCSVSNRCQEKGKA